MNGKITRTDSKNKNCHCPRTSISDFNTQIIDLIIDQKALVNSVILTLK